MKAALITKILHSRGVLSIALLAMIASAYYALAAGAVNPIIDDKGALIPAPGQWIVSPLMSMGVNIVLLLAIVGLMIFINKAYNIPRTITLIYATFFAVLETATPDLTSQLSSGTILALVIIGAMTLMCSAYACPEARRRVFLIFFMLSSAVAFQYAFAVYIPVFLVACAQMRIFTFRTILAALLGIITPWWILLGAGIISLEDFRVPQFVSVLGAADRLDTLITVITIGLTVLLAATAYMLSLLKLMTYNARMRACNGLLTLLTFVTVLAMAVDFTNFISYLTLFNCFTAFFLGHLFVIRNAQRAWIAIVSIIVIYYAIYSWRIFV